MSDRTAEVDSILRQRFSVTDSFNLPNDEMEYKVTYEPTSKQNFVELCAALAPMGYTPWLVGTRKDAAIIVKRKQAPKSSNSRIPTLLFFLTVLAVAFLCLLDTETYAQYAPSLSPYLVTLVFGGAVIAIFAAHEFGHRYAAGKEGTAAPTSYFIPGFPLITYFLPNIGTVSIPREPSVNRDSLFDIYMLGPIAAFIVAVALYAVGEFAWVQSAIPFQASGGGTISNSLFQDLIDAAFSPFIRSIPSGYVRLSPFADAAFVGFFLTFLNILPITQFDGGYLTASAFGERAVRVGTYLSVLALILLDTYNYWAIAVFILLLAPRATNPQYLDEISDVSTSKKLIFFVLLAVALMSLPVPQNFARIPL